MTALLLLLFWLTPAPQAVPSIQAPTPTAPIPQVLPPAQQPGAQAVGSTLQASASYQVGPGDTLRVIGYNGRESFDQSLLVGPDGNVLVPFSVNRLIKMEGKTAKEIQDLILAEMRKIYKDPIVQVFTSGIQSKKALLVGDTSAGARTGFFPITGDETVMEFVTQNGGYTTGSNLANIQVTHKETGQKTNVDLYDTLLNGGKSGYLKVEPNDIIYIPSLQTVSNKVFIINEGRSGTILQTPDKLTLLEALTRGASLVVGSRLEEVYVIRLDPKDATKTPLVIKVHFTDLYKKGNLAVNITTENGDIVFVPKSRVLRVSDVINAVTPVMGFVQNLVLYSAAFKTGG